MLPPPATGKLYWTQPFGSQKIGGGKSQVRAGMSIPTPRLLNGNQLYLSCFYDGSLMLKIDNDQLRGHSAGLAEEPRPVGLVEMAVEVGREHAREGVIGKGELEGVAGCEGRVGRLPPGLLEHALALVEPDDLAPQVPSQEAGSAGDVEGARRRHGLERPAELIQLLAPAGAIALGEAAPTQVPVVVLGGPPLVVRLHGPRLRT